MDFSFPLTSKVSSDRVNMVTVVVGNRRRGG
jgi:hypothetical protein